MSFVDELSSCVIKEIAPIMNDKIKCLINENINYKIKYENLLKEYQSVLNIPIVQNTIEKLNIELYNLKKKNENIKLVINEKEKKNIDIVDNNNPIDIVDNNNPINIIKNICKLNFEDATNLYNKYNKDVITAISQYQSSCLNNPKTNILPVESSYSTSKYVVVEEEDNEEEDCDNELCKNENCSSVQNDEYDEKCVICPGYYKDDGLNDILFIEENPNNKKGTCNLCKKTDNIVQMKGTGQYICQNACDESDDEEEDDEEDAEQNSVTEKGVQYVVGALLASQNIDVIDDGNSEEEEEEESAEEEEEEEESAEEEEVEEEEEEEEKEEEEEEESAEEDDDEEEEEEEEEESAEEDDDEEEEEEEEEESAEEEEVEEEKEESAEEDDDEEEEEEVEEIEINGKLYYSSDTTKGDIYSIEEDTSVGDKIGRFSNGTPLFFS